MSYLFDTNIISETIKVKADQKVIEWLGNIEPSLIYVSVLSFGEIRKGIELLEAGIRKETLTTWLEIKLPLWLGNRLLPITTEVADKWGYMQAIMKKPLAAIDSLLAATALHHDLTIVTRNEKDFQYPGLRVFNPFRNSNSPP